MNKTFKLITAWAAIISGSVAVIVSVYNIILINL